MDVVKVLLKAGANIEDHNENGHTPLMEAASAGHVEVARVLLEYGAGINTHSNEFKESALTLACYKGIVSCLVLWFCLNLFARIYLTKTFSYTLNFQIYFEYLSKSLQNWILVLNSTSKNALLWCSGIKSVFVSRCVVGVFDMLQMKICNWLCPNLCFDTPPFSPSTHCHIAYLISNSLTNCL